MFREKTKNGKEGKVNKATNYKSFKVGKGEKECFLSTVHLINSPFDLGLTLNLGSGYQTKKGQYKKRTVFLISSCFCTTVP